MCVRMYLSVFVCVCVFVCMYFKLDSNPLYSLLKLKTIFSWSCEFYLLSQLILTSSCLFSEFICMLVRVYLWWWTMIECSFICLCVAVMWCSMMIFYQNLCIYNIYNLTYRNEKWCAMSDI